MDRQNILNRDLCSNMDNFCCGHSNLNRKQNNNFWKYVSSIMMNNELLQRHYFIWQLLLITSLRLAIKKQLACYMWRASANRRKQLPEPSFEVVSRNLVLIFIYWTKQCEHRITVNYSLTAVSAVMPAVTLTVWVQQWCQLSDKIMSPQH